MAADDEDDLDDEIARLEELFKELSDEEAEKIGRDMQMRARRARLNPGSAIADSDVGAVAYEVVKMVAVLILEGTVKIRTASQARDVAAIFHQIARLETGKSTANAELSRSEREAAIAELTEAAAKRAEERAEGLRLVRDDDTGT